MAMTTKMLLVAIVFYGLIFAAVVAVIVWAVKYLIRYGIDYYLKSWPRAGNLRRTDL